MTRVENWEQRSEWPLAVCALAFLGAYAWPILNTGLSSSERSLCRYVDYGAWLVFVVDYVMRLVLTDHRVRYASRHIPDLLVIALPILRPLRLLRVVMLLKVLNRRAADSMRGRVAIYVGCTTILVVFCAALAELDAERHSSRANIHTFGESLWWAVTTMSTVGYGDYRPVTTEGRFMAGGLMLAVVALLGVVTAAIASWLIDAVREVEADSQAATRADIALLHAELVELRAQLSQLPIGSASHVSGKPER